MRVSYSWILSCLVLLLGPVVGRADGPVSVRVGDAQVDGSILTPYTNRWRLTVAKPGGEAVEVAVVSDQVRELDLGGHRVLERTQVTTYTKGISTKDVNVFDPKTLAPISMDWSRSDTGESRHRDFRGAAVTERHRATPTAEAEQHQATFDAPVFDFYGGMYGLLAAALPLGEGYSAKLPAVAERELRAAPATVRVVGRESVEAGAGKSVDAWVVDADTDLGPMTFWITKTAPYIIKLKWTADNGATWVYTMA